MAKRKRRRKIRADQQKEKQNGIAKRKTRTDQQSGKTEEKNEIAKTLIAKGFEKNEIAEITKLSIEEIENLIKENKKLD